ncbi:MAG: hypothetical protein ACTIAM_06425 [Pseudolactococcus laudensis]|nr:hypothetical protein [Lactococcus laudensis]
MSDFEKTLALIKNGELTKLELQQLSMAIQSRILSKPSVQADISV